MPKSLPVNLSAIRPSTFNRNQDTDHIWQFKTKPSAIYVAASVHNQNQAIRLALRLIRAGFVVTSRWLDFDFSTTVTEDPWKYSNSRERHETWGVRDIEDVAAADTLVLLANVASSSGGYHVELGLALGQNKNVLVIGDRKNVFYWTPQVQYLPDDSDLIEFLQHPDHGKVPLPDDWLDVPAEVTNNA